MFRIKNSIVALSFFVALLVSTSTTSYAQSASSKDVNVVNTPSVNVANTPNVNVTNTPNVNIANAPDVKVTNTPDVRSADNPARQPVEAKTACTLTDDTGACSGSIYTVPAGKRLVIEFVTMNAQTRNAGEVAQLMIEISGGGSTYFLPLTAPSIDFFGEQIISAPLAQQVRIYVEAGRSIVMKGRTNGTGGAQTARFNFTLSGHLVDVQ